MRLQFLTTLVLLIVLTSSTVLPRDPEPLVTPIPVASNSGANTIVSNLQVLTTETKSLIGVVQRITPATILTLIPVLVSGLNDQITLCASTISQVSLTKPIIQKADQDKVIAALRTFTNNFVSLLKLLISVIIRQPTTLGILKNNLGSLTGTVNGLMKSALGPGENVLSVKTILDLLTALFGKLLPSRSADIQGLFRPVYILLAPLDQTGPW